MDAGPPERGRLARRSVDMSRIAFIGLGNMGAGMAARQAAAGHEVQAFDLSGLAVERAVQAGCKAAGSAAEAVEGAELVITMLPAGAHVRQVFAEAVLPGVSRTALLIDCSTIDVDSARAVAAQAREVGVSLRRRAGLRRDRGGGGRHADLHGRLRGGALRRYPGGAQAHGQGRGARGRGRGGAGGQDLQQHGAGHIHAGRLRGLRARRAAGAEARQVLRHRLPVLRTVLVDLQLLPLARAWDPLRRRTAATRAAS